MITSVTPPPAFHTRTGAAVNHASAKDVAPVVVMTTDALAANQRSRR